VVGLTGIGLSGTAGERGEGGGKKFGLEMNDRPMCTPGMVCVNNPERKTAAGSLQHSGPPPAHLWPCSFFTAVFERDHEHCNGNFRNFNETRTKDEDMEKKTF
jgi:hypothetical protein